MMELRKVDEANVSEYIKQLYSRKPAYMNYFGQALTSNDLYCRTDHSLVIAKPSDDFYRTFILSEDRDDAVALLKSLDGVHVMNLPSKGDITAWQQFMSDAGYKSIGVYERFYYQKFRPGGNLEQINFAKSGQEEEIYNLFHECNAFNPHLDYLPSHDEVRQFVNNEQVIVIQQSDEILGAYIFVIEGKKCYFQIWADRGSNNGFKLILDLHVLMREKGISYAYLWINSENTKVKSIHQILGAKPDGLKDYTFAKF